MPPRGSRLHLNIKCGAKVYYKWVFNEKYGFFKFDPTTFLKFNNTTIKPIKKYMIS